MNSISIFAIGMFIGFYIGILTISIACGIVTVDKIKNVFNLKDK